MKKGIKLIAILLVLCLLMGIGSAIAEDKFVVGFANNNDVYDYCAKFRDYLKADCEALGMEVIVTDAGGDTNVQNGQIDDMIVQDCKVISAISNDLDGSVPALEAARAAGLPYVSFLTTIRNANDYDKFIYIGSQNYDAGAMQGEFLVAALPENAKIIYFTGAPNDQQYIDRKAGLMDKLAARTDVTVLAEYNVENKKDLGMSTTEDCLQAFDHFDAIVCQNDDSALGVVEALKSAGKLDGVITVGLDGSAAALTSIAAGELTMSVLQDAKAQAQAGADVFAQIRDGVDPATIADVFVPFATITKDNVTDYMVE
ncbi:MAG: sugar ABC transporter substrate-binding protein [Eubacteriales bacterium]|nr:sugar ABC transporter substrate-binding protein [Eubacteriales bacterium]